MSAFFLNLHTFLASEQSQKHLCPISSNTAEIYCIWRALTFYEYPGFSKWRDFTITG
jgi:hypothetical protein